MTAGYLFRITRRFYASVIETLAHATFMVAGSLHPIEAAVISYRYIYGIKELWNLFLFLI